MSYLFIICVVMSTCFQIHCRADFTGHKLLALSPSNAEELDTLKKLARNPQVDVWNEPLGLNEEVNVRVPPEIANRLETDLRAKGIDVTVVTDDLQKWIDREKEENPIDNALAGRQEDFPLDVYHTYDAIMEYLDSSAERYAEIASVETIGTTYEGNAIKGIKIGSKGTDKPAIWIDSGIHAREWVAPATSLYMIDNLLKGYDTDSESKELLDTFDWYIFPVVNPDGYKHTWAINRFWRKNRAVHRSLNTNPFCRGTDPNRNFNASFGGASTSGDSCSDIYRGPSPFSEAESQAIRDGVTNIGSRLKAYFSIHSYSQLWMTPYGYTRDHPKDYEDHMKALQAVESAIENVHGENYKCGPIAETIYPAAGSSIDWVYDDAKVKYSFALELRDTGRQGFMLSNRYIIPTAEENFAGIKAAAHIVKSEL
ncbi:carboxypeptidase B-like [Uloborus diversus]|uniref:carboxypeptidase B-like n=1 Tax=Uloborus diversus TaxID=327109 RepID=UPI0024099B4E|nr:carboxypeptidase B-like [Uloborus diversus]